METDDTNDESDLPLTTTTNANDLPMTATITANDLPLTTTTNPNDLPLTTTTIEYQGIQPSTTTSEDDLQSTVTEEDDSESTSGFNTGAGMCVSLCALCTFYAVFFFFNVLPYSRSLAVNFCIDADPLTFLCLYSYLLFLSNL